MPRVAIVGSGCSGLGALWALHRSTDHEVHLYEAGERLGGHTNTLTFVKDGREVAVDSGFFVFNYATYPNFIQFLKELGVDHVDTDMTFGVSRDDGAFEWAGSTLRGVFAQPRNLFSPRFWRMIFDIVRFNHFATDLLVDEEESTTDPSGGSEKTTNLQYESIGAYLDRQGYSDAFRNDYLIPMTACVWSTSADKCDLEFPAVTLVRFMWNHHLLSTLTGRLQWLTINGGSKRYVHAVMKNFPQQNVHLSSRVTSVEDINGKIILQFENGNEELFDHVILACHGDEALEIVRDSATQEEMEILRGFQTTPNTAYLHSDESLLPKRRAAWTAWNYLTTTSHDRPEHVCLTYNMNILQHIPTSTYGNVLVTMNPLKPPAASTIQATVPYRHPLYNAAAVRSQTLLPGIQNTRSISYAGAWTKYGFHEDGFSSGLKVAIEHLGAKIPWAFVDSTFSRGKRRHVTWRDWIVRIAVRLVHLGIVFAELVLALVWRVFGLRAARMAHANGEKKVD